MYGCFYLFMILSRILGSQHLGVNGCCSDHGSVSNSDCVCELSADGLDFVVFGLCVPSDDYSVFTDIK